MKLTYIGKSPQFIFENRFNFKKSEDQKKLHFEANRSLGGQQGRPNWDSRETEIGESSRSFLPRRVYFDAANGSESRSYKLISKEIEQQSAYGKSHETKRREKGK